MKQVRIENIKIGERHRKQPGDIEGLAASIADVGLLHPVIVDDRMRLVAGHRRILAAQALGWTKIPTLQVGELSKAAAALRAERDENVCREDFRPSEAVALGEALEVLKKPEAKEQQQEAGKQRGRGKIASGKLPKAINVREDVASAIGMSGKTYEKAKAVVQAARDDPEKFGPIVEQMDKTDNVNKAWQAIQKQHEAEALAEAQAKISKAARRKLASVCDIRHCSMAELFGSGIEPDCIVTDPPYAREYLPLYGELAKLAKSVPLVAVMCGQSWLPEVIAMMCQHLTYRWMFAYLTPGGQAVQAWDRKINTFWKPILVFGHTVTWSSDVCRSAINDNDKRFHNWGQSESGMADLVERLSKPDQLVCDPFLGAGTTAVVSLRLSRRFVGCDIEEGTTEKAIQRCEALYAGQT